MINIKMLPKNLNDIFIKYDEEFETLKTLQIKNELLTEFNEDTKHEKDIFILDCYISKLRNAIFMGDLVIKRLTQDNPELVDEALKKIYKGVDHI